MVYFIYLLEQHNRRWNKINMTQKIDSSTGEYYFLSNFSDSVFVYDGIRYQNAESAFQAQKCENKADRKQFSDLNSTEAKNSAGRF